MHAINFVSQTRWLSDGIGVPIMNYDLLEGFQILPGQRLIWQGIV